MHRRKKALIVAHSSHRGGAEYCLDTTLRHLDRSRFDATVVFPFEGPMSEAARSYGYSVHMQPLLYWLYCDKSAWYWKNLLGRSWHAVFQLHRLIRQTGADVVYTNTSAIFESAIAARLAHVPHVWHIHEVLDNGSAMRQLLPLPIIRRLIYRLSNRIVFESQAARKVFESSTPSDKSHVVHNSLRLGIGETADLFGTGVSQCTDASEPRGVCDARARFGLEANDSIVGFVGQFIERKNPLLLIRALARLKSIPRLKCLFVGDGPLRETMRAEITRFGLGRTCRIVEFQTDISPVMRAIDVLALPSRQESFGLVLVEAAFHGKPAIACECEGPGEIIADGATGMLVRQENDAELARAIERLFLDSRARLLMGRKAAERTAQLFSPVTNTRRLEAIMLSLIAPSDAELPPRDVVDIGGANRAAEPKAAQAS